MDDMVEQVLLLCPGCDREDVENDLNLTGDLERTMNHALDGLLSPCRNTSQSTTPSTTEKTITIIDDNISSTKYTSIVDKPSASPTTSRLPSSLGNIERNTVSSTQSLRSFEKSTFSSTHTTKDNCLRSTNTTTNAFVEVSDSEMDDLTSSALKDQKRTACRVFNRELTPDSDDSLPAAFDDDDGLTTSLLSRLTSRNTLDTIREDVSKESNILGSLGWKNDHSVKVLLSSASSTENVNVGAVVGRSAKAVASFSRDGNTCLSDEVEEPTKQRRKRSKEEIEEQKKITLLKKQARDKERQEKQNEKQRQKDAKAAEREQKKVEAEKEKLQKKAEKLTQSTMTIGACVKLVTVCLDPSFFPQEDLTQNLIIHKLSSMEASYKINPQPHPGSVTWLRASVQHSVQGDGLTITSSNTYSEEKEVLVVLPADQFAQMVYVFKQGPQAALGQPDVQTLVDFTKNVKSLYQGKKITFLLTGLEKYMRNVKTKQQRAFRDAATASSSDDSATDGGRKKPRKRKLGATVNVTRTDIEEALVDLQIKTNVCVYPCEEDEDVAMKVGLFTKAIAERPYKKSVADGFGFCLDKLDKTALKVSKDGQGLVRVWQQQIEQFRNVSKDMAAAIVASYPSPQLLLKAYSQCGSHQQAQLLLEDILVRRGGGSLATSRRIGPELSKRFYILFHSNDSTELMKQ